VHNFDSFYYQNKGRPYGARELLVVDEAHNLEQRYLSFMSFTLSNRRDPLLAIPEYSSAHQYKLFVQEQRDVLTNLVVSLESKDTLTTAELTMMEEANDLLTKLTIFLTKVDKSEYVVDYENKDAYVSVTFRPVFVGNYIVENLLPVGRKVLMLSATILDKNMFCKSVGLSPDEVEFIQMDSYFPAKNRPVIRKYVGSMSHKDIEDSLPRAVEALREVLAKFPDRRGIEQTHSERIANYIKYNMADESRLTFRKDFATTEGMLEAHRMKSNSFIVASGLREGLDLHGDLSRIQVIMKVPYPDLGDKRTKRKKELDSSWYGVQTALSFVQMIGRSVRSKEDKAVTYIFDSSFEMFYNMNRRFIPHYVRESIR
jgi:Rad3-related DNA helicase